MKDISNPANNCQRRRTAISEKRSLAANKHTEPPPKVPPEEERIKVKKGFPKKLQEFNPRLAEKFDVIAAIVGMQIAELSRETNDEGGEFLREVEEEEIFERCYYLSEEEISEAIKTLEEEQLLEVTE